MRERAERAETARRLAVAEAALEMGQRREALQVCAQRSEGSLFGAGRWHMHITCSCACTCALSLTLTLTLTLSLTLTLTLTLTVTLTLSRTLTRRRAARRRWWTCSTWTRTCRRAPSWPR